LNPVSPEKVAEAAALRRAAGARNHVRGPLMP
jgi:hypothetical protein